MSTLSGLVLVISGAHLGSARLLTLKERIILHSIQMEEVRFFCGFIFDFQNLDKITVWLEDNTFYNILVCKELRFAKFKFLKWFGEMLSAGEQWNDLVRC